MDAEILARLARVKAMLDPEGSAYAPREAYAEMEALQKDAPNLKAADVARYFDAFELHSLRVQASHEKHRSPLT